MYVNVENVLYTQTFQKNTIALMQNIKVSRHLKIIQLSFVGSVTKSHDNNKYLWIVIDHFTKYAQAYATETCDTSTVINCLENYFYAFEVSESLQVDSDTAFESHNFNNLCKKFGVRAAHITAYHAQCQCQVDKFNGTLTITLLNYTGGKQTNWTDYVNLCIFTYNTAVRKSIKISPYEAMFWKKAKTTFSTLVDKR